MYTASILPIRRLSIVLPPHPTSHLLFTIFTVHKNLMLLLHRGSFPFLSFILCVFLYFCTYLLDALAVGPTAQGLSKTVNPLRKRSVASPVPSDTSGTYTYSTTESMSNSQNTQSTALTTDGTGMTVETPVLSLTTHTLSSSSTLSSFPTALSSDVYVSHIGDPSKYDASLYDNNFNMSTMSTAAESPITPNKTSILGYFNDGDVVYIHDSQFNIYLTRCEGCLANKDGVKVDPIYWSASQSSSPGRLSQIAIELVNMTNNSDSTKSAFIRMRADSGFYIRASPYLCPFDPSCLTNQIGVNNYTLYADAVSPDTDGTVFQVTGNWRYFALQMRDGHFLTSGYFVDYSKAVTDVKTTQFVQSLSNPYSATFNAKIADVSIASSTRPVLRGNALAPFGPDDSFTINYFGYPWVFVDSIQDNNYVNGYYANLTNVILVTDNYGYNKTFFRANFIGDPRDGIVRFSLTNGKQVYLADKSSSCAECKFLGGLLLFADSSDHTTDWKLVPVYGLVSTWYLEVVAIDGVKQDPPLKPCLNGITWPSGARYAQTYAFPAVKYCPTGMLYQMTFNII